MFDGLRKYIKEGWERAETTLSTPNFTPPCSFVPPCAEGEFRVLYYWDTYFTNVGLIEDKRTDLARNNVNVLLYALDKFGCVPNCAQEGGATWASQPPLLFMMVRDLYNATGDKEQLEKGVAGLEKEYAFWQKNRSTPIGLNQYKGNTDHEQTLADYYDYVATRLDQPTDIPLSQKALRGKNFLAEGESGEDFTPRYGDHHALDFVQVDLNSHLYGLEDFLAEYFADNDIEKSKFYAQKRDTRKALMQKYCYDEESGLWFDYDFVNGKRSKMRCVACFLPYFHGIAENGRGLEILCERLLGKSGVYACEDVGKTGYQWGYPYIWAPYQYFAYKSLKRYGFEKQAEEVCVRYKNLLETCFDETGEIWERYDENGVAPSTEYTTQKMLGWTAGVYNYFYGESLKK